MTNGQKVEKKMVYADLSLLFVALAWGGGFVVLKDALDSITPFYVMAVRFALTALILMIIFWKKFKNISKQDINAGMIIGVFLFLGFATQTVGLQYTTASKSAFLTGTNVVIVPFLAWMVHKQRPDGYAMVSTFIALIGIALLTLEGSLTINNGDALTLACAVSFAGHIVSVGYLGKGKDPLLLTTLQMIVAALLFIIFAALFEPVPETLISSDIFGAVAYMVLFPTLLAFLIQNVAQQLTTSTHAALILCLESVFGTLLAVIILKESLTIQAILGCTLIFAAIVITETKLSFLPFNRKLKDPLG